MFVNCRFIFSFIRSYVFYRLSKIFFYSSFLVNEMWYLVGLFLNLDYISSFYSTIMLFYSNFLLKVWVPLLNS